MRPIQVTRPHFVVIPSSSLSISSSTVLLFRRSRSRSSSPLSITSSSSYWIVRSNHDENTQFSSNHQQKQVIVAGNSAGILSACFVGLLTGLSVVLFNNLVHEIRDLCWDGIPSRGALWLRELQRQDNTTWGRIILIPTCGGLVVSLLNTFQTALDEGKSEEVLKGVLKPFLKAVAAAVTLGTGNSLGPEGPSVEIGVSVANGVASIFEKDDQRKLSLKAAGSAAGIASGFNAAVAGCFFAVESVLWASSSLSLTNSTSTVILSAVIASVVSEIGLGSEPAFTVPDYDFRSPSELPLYLLLGIFCGVVSLSFSWCTSWMMVATDKIQNTFSIPKPVFPVVGGFTVGLIALRYPEVLYWGFDNVDTLLESRPFAKGLPVDLLLQLIGIKIVATSFCRACGLVGGYYAPSLFIGAATGMAYGKLFDSLISIFHLSGIEVASPQAYGLVGMAATLAGVCQVPLTAVLLLFELTHDYRIVLPLLGAVGLSSWISSRSIKRNDPNGLKVAQTPQQPDKTLVCGNDVEEVSLMTYNFNENTVTKKLLVSEAMKTQYVTVVMNTRITQVLALMLAEKQSCAIIVDDHNFFKGLLTLQDIQKFCQLSKERNIIPEELVVGEVCSVNELYQYPQTVTPIMNLYSAELIMNTHGMTQLPVILEKVPVGILDRESINIACRAFATREYLISCSTLNDPKN